MKKLKDLCLGVLINEGYEPASMVSPDVVGDVVNVDFDKNEGYIKIDFNTTFGKNMNLVTKIDSYKKWANQNKGKFKDFVVDYLSSSQEGDESLNEIVDDSGAIMGDDDMPNNSTNSLVVGPKFDLEKIYKSLVPKSIRFYSGDLGIGVITW